MWEARVKHLWRLYYVEGCERFLGKSIFYVTFRHSTFWSEQDRKYILCNFFIGKLRHCERATKFEKKSPSCFDIYFVNQLICQNKRDIFSNFWCLFRIAETMYLHLNLNASTISRDFCLKLSAFESKSI